MRTDPPVVEAVEKYLNGQLATPRRGPFADPFAPPRPLHAVMATSMRVGLVFGPDMISTTPGGLGLFLRCPPPSPPIVALDYAFDLSDQTVDLLRNSIVEALEQSGFDFMPVSINAVSRVGPWPGGMALIDRDGLECVFTHCGKYFVSGYDRNESPPLYFLARLPRAVKTLAEGIESLKPRSVKEAESLGLKVLRQGDMFAIPTSYTTSDLKKMDAEFVTPTGSVGLYGTAHWAAETARLPDGTMLGRGQIQHSPRMILNERRDPDHQALKLPGSKWWLIVRNTVPVVAPTPPTTTLQDRMSRFERAVTNMVGTISWAE